MSLATNVVRRGGSYYFRTRVPKALVPLLGRSELWKSLRTNDIFDARLRAAAQSVLIQHLWVRLQPDMTMQDANQIVKECLAAEIRNYERLRADLSGMFGGKPPSANLGSHRRAEPSLPVAESGLTVSKAGRLYILHLQAAGEVGRKRMQDCQKAIDAFEAWGGDIDIAAISASVAGRYMADLLRYPVNASKKARYRDLSFAERVEEVTRSGDKDTLHPTTINGKYLTPLKLLFDHHRRTGYADALPANPFVGISAKSSRKSRRDERRRDFMVSEMQRLFDQPLHTGAAALSGAGLYQTGDQRVSDWRYWVPLIGAFSGARLNEVCGLAVADFRREDGIDFFLIRASLEEQKIKTDSSWRKVPVHSALIELGLLGFVERQRRANAVRLFPDLKPDRFNHLSDIPSKFFSRQIARIVDPDPDIPGKLTFHSLRHTVIGRMRSADVRPDVSKQVVGHEDGDTHSGYGQVALDALKRAIEKVEYEGLDLTRVKLPDHLLC